MCREPLAPKKMNTTIRLGRTPRKTGSAAIPRVPWIRRNDPGVMSLDGPCPETRTTPRMSAVCPSGSVGRGIRLTPKTNNPADSKPAIAILRIRFPSSLESIPFNNTSIPIPARMDAPRAARKSDREGTRNRSIPGKRRYANENNPSRRPAAKIRASKTSPPQALAMRRSGKRKNPTVARTRGVRPIESRVSQ